MRNRHGTPIWYELMSKDPQAARRFYGAVGGVFTLTAEMTRQGARPCWLMYIGVDDVDACVAEITAVGGMQFVPCAMPCALGVACRAVLVAGAVHHVERRALRIRHHRDAPHVCDVECSQ